MSIWRTAKPSDLILKHSPKDYELDMSIGKGWESIAHRLTQQLDYADPKFTVTCIKEKFGEFRYYVTDISNDEIIQECVFLLLEKAAHEAKQTCECCGSTSSVKKDRMSWGWVVTLCNECKETLEEERRNGEF